jgi:hypothetical protein
METVLKYAIAAGIIGLIPFSVIVLIPLEIIMIYHLSVINRRPFNLGELSVIWIVLLFVSGFGHGAVEAIFVFLGPIGWVAKAAFAFCFVVAFGGLVNWYYGMENKKQGSSQLG